MWGNALAAVGTRRSPAPPPAGHHPRRRSLSRGGRGLVGWGRAGDRVPGALAALGAAREPVRCARGLGADAARLPQRSGKPAPAAHHPLARLGLDRGSTRQPKCWDKYRLGLGDVGI